MENHYYNSDLTLENEEVLVLFVCPYVRLTCVCLLLSRLLFLVLSPSPVILSRPPHLLTCLLAALTLQACQRGPLGWTDKSRQELKGEVSHMR